MIIQPEFLEHWKTRLLVEMTGDESSPLAVIRLWAHCQNSKRGYFPDMTPAQLASICRWQNRKPACHVALVRCGFVEKLIPKGFAAHEWADHNRQLIQKWEAGKNGGRPPKEENVNELALNAKPTDNRPITVRELDRTDRTEQIEKTDKNRTEQTAAGGSGSGSLNGEGVCSGLGSVQSTISTIARTKTAFSYPISGVPTLAEVHHHMEGLFQGGGEFASDWLDRMNQQQWRDGKGIPVTQWKPLASSWANACEKNRRGVSSKPKPKR